MTHVAFLIDTISCDTAGTQKQLLETIKRIDDKRFKITLICLYESDWMKKNSLPCKPYILNYKGFFHLSILRVMLRLRSFLKQSQVDILQTFFEDSIFVAYISTMFTKTPLLLSSRRDIGLGSGNQPWYHRIYRFLLPFVNRSFSGIVANSQQVSEFVSQREKTSLNKIVVIRNGVEIPGRFDSVRPDIFNNDFLWIAVVASLTPVKRHDLLFRALSLLRDREDMVDVYKSIRVLLLGDGPQRQYLEALCSSLNIEDLIVFAGSVKDVSRYLDNIDIGVLCSDREGLSNAILEYMAHGKPVIATAVGGNIELVSSENGILVPAGDADALAAALANMLRDPDYRRSLGGKSYEIVETNFSWQKSMTELENYYARLLEA